MNDNKIKCMYFNHRFKEKPQGKQCGWVQKSLTQTDITIENLADALCHGASFKPGVLVGGNKAENWYQQQLFGLDFDDGIRIVNTDELVHTARSSSACFPVFQCTLSAA